MITPFRIHVEVSIRHIEKLGISFCYRRKLMVTEMIILSSKLLQLFPMSTIFYDLENKYIIIVYNIVL